MYRQTPIVWPSIDVSELKRALWGADPSRPDRLATLQYRPTEQFHWRHTAEKVCITVAFHKETELFLGINTFGIRMRHEIFDRWLTEERDMNYVMEHLSDANFDPEFYKQYEKEVVFKYNSDYGKSIQTKKKSIKRIFQLY